MIEHTLLDMYVFTSSQKIFFFFFGNFDTKVTQKISMPCTYILFNFCFSSLYPTDYGVVYQRNYLFFSFFYFEPFQLLYNLCFCSLCLYLI